MHDQPPSPPPQIHVDPPKAGPVVRRVALVCVVAFVGMLAAGGWGGPESIEYLVAFGAKDNALVDQGQVYRLLSCAFLHVGWLHLLLNATALFGLAPVLETIAGPRLFFVLYVTSALGGGALSYLCAPHVISAGASGALFGVAGALLAVGYLYPAEVPQHLASQAGRGAVPFCVYNLAFGFANTGIDNYAHLGGLLVGMLGATLLFGLRKFGRVASMIHTGLAVTCLVIVLGALGQAAANIPAGVREARQAQRAIALHNDVLVVLFREVKDPFLASRPLFMKAPRVDAKERLQVLQILRTITKAARKVSNQLPALRRGFTDPEPIAVIEDVGRELRRLEAMEKILQVNADASLVDQIFEPTFDVPLVELIKGTDAALARIMAWQTVAFAKYRLKST